MGRVKKRNENNDIVQMRFDVPMLNTFIKYSLMQEYVTKQHLSTLNMIIAKLDYDIYKYDEAIYNRVILLKYILEAKLDMNMVDLELVKSYILTKDTDLGPLVNELTSKYVNSLTHQECEYITKVVYERVQYIFIYLKRASIIDLLNKMDNGDFVTYDQIVTELREDLSSLLGQLQNAEISTGVLRAFNFSDPDFPNKIELILNKIQKDSAVLMTGVRALNNILAPGFQSSRFYVILGLTGKFKSGLLLNIADQIRLYNPQLKAVEGQKRKTVLFVTMENDIEETLVRVFDMYDKQNTPLKHISKDQMVKILRDDGKYSFTDSDGIDIEFRYYNNLEIKTSELYNLILSLNDNGRQVIAIILDYIKRIDSARPSQGDERLRLSFVSKELKDLSKFFDIPVITAMQINRTGNGIIDAAMREDKEDLARFVGMADVGMCWDIMEDADWVTLINLERQKSTNQIYLTFNRLKMRGRQENVESLMTYFNHPFADGKEIRLEPDVNLPQSLSIRSLASDLEGVDINEAEKRNAQKRPQFSTIKADNQEMLNDVTRNRII